MKIGELAQKTACPIETIRFYEQQGLLAMIARTGSNYRVYSDLHVARLRSIMRCRSLDMALDEIPELLKLNDAPTENCAEVNDLLDAHIGHVSERIRELCRLER
jgi:DNA-binding transcriptional MerR regulator